jgi:3-hydroxy-9,10-secoandrosta-1,3,5(10)-triene-9,17-dione monooxygenase
MPPSPTQSATKEEIMDRVRAMAPRFAERAAAAEEARRIPQESVNEMLDAGFARILVPKSVGGYGLSFDTWFEVTRELCKADASHGWCASLIIHHNHLIAQYPQAAQKTLWANGLDVPVAASFAPAVQAVPVDGGYRVSGKGSPFASGVDHCTWVMLGGMAQDGGPPEWKFFLVAPGDYTVSDTWFTTGMRGTGSKTIVTDNAFVPSERVLKLTELRDAKTPGGAVHEDTIFHTPFFYYAPISFATPMLGAAQGAYEHFRDWTKTRRAQDGSSLAEKTSLQVRMARAAADLDAADLLLRRAVNVTDAPQDYSPNHLARSVRDFARVSELTVSVIDTLIALSGTASFNTSHPLQRAWRDIHFMSMHIAVNTEMNFSHYGRMELGLGRDASRPYF